MTTNFKLSFAALALSSSVVWAQALSAQTAAPIERANTSAAVATDNTGTPAQAATDVPVTAQVAPVNTGRPRHLASPPASHVMNPAQGVRILTNANIQTVTSENGHLELKMTRGKANVLVDHPADNALILVDLPGGQVDLLKDGFYTLNAETNRVSVLHGEAQVFALDAPPNAEGKKVKEGQGVLLNDRPHPEDLYDAQLQADILPWSGGPDAADAAAAKNQAAYSDSGCSGCSDDGYGDYGYGYGYAAGYPYYGYGLAYGYPGWGWGWGYPGYGYWGGWGWGGGGYYRGGWGGYRGGVPIGFHGAGVAGGFRGGASTMGGGFHGGGMGGGGGFHGGGGGGGHR